MPKASASSFANWVFERNNPHWSPPTAAAQSAQIERMKLGVADHAAVELFMMHIWTVRKFSHTGTVGWNLWFADQGDNATKPFEASRLVVDDVPLKCVPDVVLQHKATNSYLIIERKTTATDSIPKDGWPNIEAQLWCYSHIDDFKQATNVFLVAQLWVRVGRSLSLHSHHPSWRRGQASHETRCTNWFTEYGGRYREEA